MPSYLIHIHGAGLDDLHSVAEIDEIFVGAFLLLSDQAIPVGVL